MKNTISQLQQGDVCLLKISDLPVGCKAIKPDQRGIVLAEGEITGHYHGLSVGEELTGKLELLEAPDRTRYLRNDTDAPVTIRHAEHQPVEVPPGIWQVGQVREKDWFADMVRTVRD
jgi:hypothetical protein